MAKSPRVHRPANKRQAEQPTATGSAQTEFLKQAGKAPSKNIPAAVQYDPKRDTEEPPMRTTAPKPLVPIAVRVPEHIKELIDYYSNLYEIKPADFVRFAIDRAVSVAIEQEHQTLTKTKK